MVKKASYIPHILYTRAAKKQHASDRWQLVSLIPGFPARKRCARSLRREGPGQRALPAPSILGHTNVLILLLLETGVSWVSEVVDSIDTSRST